VEDFPGYHLSRNPAAPHDGAKLELFSENKKFKLTKILSSLAVKKLIPDFHSRLQTDILYI